MCLKRELWHKRWGTCTTGSYTGTKRNVARNSWAESPGDYSEWKKPVPKGHVPNDSVCITFSKWQNDDMESVRGCQGSGGAWGGGGVKEQLCLGGWREGSPWWQSSSVSTISGQILAGIVCYDLTRCHRWERLGRGDVASVYYFLQLHVNSQLWQILIKEKNHIILAHW